MSLPNLLKVQPAVLFDPANAAHRGFYHNFRVNRTWKNAPRFVLEDQFMSVPDMISSKMLDYYMKSEFDPVTRKAGM